MTIAVNIQIFLKSKFDKLKIKRKDFILGSGISHSIANRLTNGLHTNPALITIIKIADYFNCSIDEIIGRKTYLLINNENQRQFKTIALEEISNNIQLYILNKLKIRNLTVERLEIACNTGRATIWSFLKEKQGNNTRKILSTKSILAIANYFDVSIDEIIGRVNIAI